MMQSRRLISTRSTGTTSAIRIPQHIFISNHIMINGSSRGVLRSYDSDPGEYLATVCSSPTSSSNANFSNWRRKKLVHCTHRMVGLKKNCNSGTSTSNMPPTSGQVELNGSNTNRTHHLGVRRDSLQREHSANCIAMSDAGRNSFRNLDENEDCVLTEEHYWDRLGLIVDHPHCSICLKNLAEKGIKVPRQCGNGPSSFIPASEFLTEQNGRDEEQARELFIEVFLQTNRLDHLTTVMGLHPSYLDAFLRTQDYMLRGDGPLPFDYRHYIAILASARNSCGYIVRLQESEFLLQGGDPEWLQGITHTPLKLQNLYELIKFVAHQPWLITKEHVEKLLKGSHSWALSELVHAIAIATHFASISSFTFGCGINLEVDMDGGHTLRPPSFTDSAVADEDGLSNNNYSEEMLSGNVETIMKRMKELSEAEEPEDSQEEKMKKFERVEKQNVELVSPSVEEQNRLQADLSHYLIEPDFKYKDFAKRGKTTQIPTFRAQDYSWDDHGFSLVNRYYTDAAPLLDDKFRLTYSLTYNTMGKKKEVDTSLLRRAIWNYIHSLFGIRHDDYDYGEVNELLDRNLKMYIKTVTCYPEKAGMKDYEGFWRDFKHSEKVHVNMMILEARMQASLLYCLRAIMRYMT